MYIHVFPLQIIRIHRRGSCPHEPPLYSGSWGHEPRQKS